VFDFYKKEVSGIVLEKDFLKVATLTVDKDGVTVTSLRRIKLSKPIKEAFQPKPKDLGIDDDFDMDMSGDDEIFGVDDSVSANTVLSDDLVEDWDMSKDTADTFEDDSNAFQVAGFLAEISAKSIVAGLSVPLEQTYLQTVRDIDLKKTGSRKLRKLLKEKLASTYGHEITDDQYSWITTGNSNELLVGSVERNISVLGLIDEALPIYKGKVNVRSIQSEETLLMGLVRTNYELLEHQYTCIIHVEQSSSHVIFMKGKDFHSILPVINEGAKHTRVPRTIFSKILFEVDRGKIPTLDRIVITGETLEGELLRFLSEQFLDVEVLPFEYDGNKFDVSAMLTDDYRDYLKPIAAAWAASEQVKTDFMPLSLLPKYVTVRQQVLKIEWHGVILLMMIALTPALFNFQFQQKQAELQETRQTIQRLDQQINDTRAIARIVESMSAEYGIYDAKVTLLDNLSQGTLKWSRTLQLLNMSAQQTGSIWITMFQGDETNLVFQGVATRRDRIAPLVNSFHTATLQQVVEREERGVIVYDFTVLVTRISGDQTVFDPERATVPENLSLPQETTGESGTIVY
jgi:hypothetical protein